MRLKKLEISGFKSFRDKVVLDFSDGISAVVGPNGCGKSNIVDAIRWVMGEQRVKLLRGKKMDDVIFNGSETASPVGMAQVSMTLANTGGSFPGIYNECSEVTVARRNIRDGDSEYILNQIPCRLLDIKEFFMGTGIGARAYSLVEQNSVASLVEAKPEDRRHFIEEAAGVSKYKSRKEMAVRKLEATQQNMVRLSDIIKEVKSQLNAISRQAKRAEQYKTLKKRIREGEVTLALQSYADHVENRDRLVSIREENNAQELAVRTQLKSIEASQEQEKVAHLENEGLLSHHQEHLFTIRNQISIKEKGIEFAKQQIEEAKLRKERSIAEIEALKGRCSAKAMEMDELEAALADADIRIAELRTTVGEMQGAMEEARRTEKDLHLELEEKKITLIDAVSGKTNAKNMMNTLLRTVEDIGKREDRRQREEEEQKKRREEVGKRLDDAKTLLMENTTRLEEDQVRKAETMDSLESSKNDRQELDEEITRIKEELGRKSARLHSLKEFQEGYAWCDEGTKSFITAARNGQNETLPEDTFLGVLADHIDVPKGYETAVEAVLGDKLQYILVKNHQDGVKAIDYLRTSSLGRCSFVPLELRSHASRTADYEHLKDAIPILDKITVREDFKDLAQCLLGDVLMIPDLHNGISLWRQNGFYGTFVTPQGDIISPLGVLTGGTPINGDKSLLQNKREISELEIDVLNLTTSIEKETENRRRITAMIAQGEEELGRLRSEIHRLDLEINGRKKDIERYEDEANRTRQRIDVLDLDKEHFTAEANEAGEKMRAMEADTVRYERQEQEIQEGVAVIQNQWHSLRSDLERQEAALTEQKVLLASLEEKRASGIRTREATKVSIADLTREIEVKSQDSRKGEENTQEKSQQIITDTTDLETLYKGYGAAEETLNRHKAIQQDRESALARLEKEIRIATKVLEEILGKKSDLDVKSREIALHMESLKTLIQEKNDGQLTEFIENFQKLDDISLATIQETLSKDRQTVDTFGEVNLMAVAEYEELKTRYEFLSGQAADLNTSIESLQTTIARINRISRKRFADTFEAVSRSFTEVFPKLFPGGHGVLRLTDESDMLETGVDIDIQVPGKRTQSISLLSGGEKSLAAIALIFAILMYKPSPFLVLDEVDAALDDANVSLFNNLLKKDIAPNSQIVMVTHNKRSMEVADNLFGVTMHQQGVSTIVSVSLN